MNVQWTWKAKEGGDEASLKRYFEGKLSRLRRLLKRYPPDQVELNVTVYHLPHRVRPWETRLVLRLSTGTLVAEEDAESPRAALDVALDELTRELRRHREKVRKDYLYRRKRRRQEVAEVIPLVVPESTADRKAAFFKLIEPFLEPVREHARQEIDILEIEGQLPRGEVTADDLTDDVVARAWEEFPSRPQSSPLDLWLIELLHRRLEELVNNRESVLMGQIDVGDREDPFTPDEDVLEEDFWLERIFGSQDVETMDETVPDAHIRDALESLSDEARQERVRRAMAKLDPHLRRTFLLHVIQGYDLEEIAMMQDRDAAAVEQDIRSASQELRTLLASDAPDTVRADGSSSS